MKIDALQQDPNLTNRQAEGLQDIYIQLRRMSRLSRSLLLLSKIENSQFRKDDHVDVNAYVRKLLPQWQTISGSQVIDVQEHGHTEVACNEMLLESLLTNLVVNAIRHSREADTVAVEIFPDKLIVSNTSEGGALDKEHIFNRFYHSSESKKGYGLGLAIVKSICDFHHWQIDYNYVQAHHVFTVDMKA